MPFRPCRAKETFSTTALWMGSGYVKCVTWNGIDNWLLLVNVNVKCKYSLNFELDASNMFQKSRDRDMLTTCQCLFLSFSFSFLLDFQIFSCSSVQDLLCCLFPFIMCQMFSMCGRSGLQVGQFSTQTISLQSYAFVICAQMWIGIVLLK